LVAANDGWLGEFVRKAQGDWPDLRLTIEDQVAAGDKVVTRWMARATHSQPVITAYGSTVPSNKQVTVTGITIDRIVGGKIAESWSNGDTLSEYQQLGAVPTPAPATR
jgi:predicted ester cyclase